MTEKSNPPADLAAEIHHWATKEMHFHPQGRHINAKMPDVEDYKSICLGQMKQIWTYIIHNVYAAQTVRKVKGNLQLHERQKAGAREYKVQYKSDGVFDEERHSLLERHQRLRAELTTKKANISHIEQDLARLRSDVSATEGRYRNSCSELQNTQRRACLLRSYSKQLEEEGAKYHEYTRRLLARVAGVARRTEAGSTYYSRSESVGEGLESACLKEVRESCDEIQAFLTDLQQGKFGSDKVKIQQSKERLWQRLEAALGGYSVSQIGDALTSHTQDGTAALRRETDNVDIKKDAEGLRFKYEQSGRLHDMSTPTSTLQSVHQLLEEGQSAHFQRFIAAEKSANHSWRLKQRHLQASDQVSECLRRQYEKNPQALELARRLVDTEQQNAMCRTTLRVLHGVSADLMEQVNMAMKVKDALYAKYQKIQDFKKIVDSKQNLIRVLVKQNQSASNDLEGQRQEVQSYVLKALNGQEADVKDLTGHLKDTVKEEVDAFSTLTLSNLLFATIDDAYKTAVCDLSINKLSANQHAASSQVMQTVLHTLQFPLYKSPESFLRHVLALKREIDDLEMTLAAHRAAAKQSHDQRDTQATVDHMQNLCQRAADHHKEQQERLLPVIQKRMSQSTHALSDVLSVKDTAQAWWEQPGQFCAPWVTVDDLTLQQWKDKWTVAVTRLRQAQITTQ